MESDESRQNVQTEYIRSVRYDWECVGVGTRRKAQE